jgi:methyl-accepting chemotaxis protein
MSFLSRIKISARLNSLSVLMIAIVCILSVVAFNGFTLIKDEVDLLNNERFFKYQKASIIENKVKIANSWIYQIAVDVLREVSAEEIDTRILEFGNILESTKEDLTVYKLSFNNADLSDINSVTTQLQDIKSEIASFTLSDSLKNASKLEQLLAKNVSLSIIVYRHKVIEVMPVVKDMALLGASLGGAMMSGTETDYQSLSQAITDLKELEIKLANSSYNNAIATYSNTSTTFLLVAFIGSILMLFFMTTIIRSIIKPLTLLLNTMNNISHGEGDLTLRLPEKGNDEITILSHHFNRFSERIQTVFISVKNVSTNIGCIATDVLSSVQERNVIAQSQLNETESVSSAIDNLTSFSNEVVNISLEASTSSATAKKTTDQATSVINHTISNMQELGDNIIASSQVVQKLGENSKNIDDILEVIFKIAQQTNLLALNAAIEAARAGEQGRGFAVVADEVRALAQRSSDATEQIRQVLQTIKSGATDASLSMAESKEKAEAIIKEAYTVTDSIAEVTKTIESSLSLSHMIAEKSREQMKLVENVQNSTKAIKEAATKSVDVSKKGELLGNNLNKSSLDLSEFISQFKV